jgi:hypothetical protein
MTGAVMLPIESNSVSRLWMASRPGSGSSSARV